MTSGPKWGTRGNKRPKGKPQLTYELIVVILVIAAIIYWAINGSGAENNGFE